MSVYFPPPVHLHTAVHTRRLAGLSGTMAPRTTLQFTAVEVCTGGVPSGTPLETGRTSMPPQTVHPYHVRTSPVAQADASARQEPLSSSACPLVLRAKPQKTPSHAIEAPT